MLAATLALSSCSLFGGQIAPNGLVRPEDALRRELSSGQFESARNRAISDIDVAGNDVLLRRLYAGLIAHYAQRHEESALHFEHAIDLYAERQTRSISRGALSVVSSDLALAYTPGRTERLAIHYFNALNYLGLGDLDGAAVEARRLSLLLQRLRDAGEPVDPQLAALLRYFAGAVFETAGDWADADVAYRNALALRPGSRLAVDPPPDTLGDVVVVIERGFVAHRVEQSIHVLLAPDEVEALTGSDREVRAAAAAAVTTRILAHAFLPDGQAYVAPHRRTIFIGPPPRDEEDEEMEACTDDDEEEAAARDANRRASLRPPGRDEVKASGRPSSAEEQRARNRDDPCEEARRRPNPYLLRIAWPAFARDARPAGQPSIVVDDQPMPVDMLTADLSRSVASELDEERFEILARTILRAATKLALTRTVERSAGGVNEGLGKVAGLVTNVTGALLERADTRSWHLLPDELHLVRLRLPPGERRITVTVPGSGSAAREVEVGTVHVRPGEVKIVSHRVYR